MNDLFKAEETMLLEAKAYLDGIGDAEFVDIERYKSLYKQFERFVRQTKRAMRISDRMTGELTMQRNELTHKAYADELTGVYNRRYMSIALESSLVSAISNRRFLSAIMLDIDFFKKYNDSFGHQQGDECLKQIAYAITSSVSRAEDVVARYGGEEFFIIMPNTDKSGATLVAQRIMANIKEANIPHPKSDVAEYVTVSMGITSCIPDQEMKPEDIIQAADEALYQAKNSCRNCYIYKATSKNL